MKRLLHYSLQIKNTAYTLALLVAAIAAYQLTAHFPLHWDATRNASNSLTASSINTLKQLSGPINITMYSSSKDAELGDVELLVREFISLYQRHKSDITLTFIDPVKNAEAMRQTEIRNNREMIIEYGGRKEHLTQLNEQAITSALLRLAHSKNQKIMYLDGHGERKPEGNANHDLGEFGKKLKQNGFQLLSINLALIQDVPTNNGVLIITQPQIKLLPGEADKLVRFIDRGGNVLWLVDAEPLNGLEKLASKLGLLLSQRTITDPDAQRMNAPDNWTLGASYPPHAITQNFNLITAFPNATPIGRDESHAQADDGTQLKNNVWKRSTLIEAASNGWASRTAIPQKPRFDNKRDLHGPFSLAIALQRTENAREQRIVVVGSGSFLANAYIGNGGNLDLGINMMNWLTHEEHLISTQPRATIDNAIMLSKNQLIMISYSFVIVLPLLLILIGGVLWWRRRR